MRSVSLQDLVLVLLLASAAVLVQACQQSEPAAPPPPESPAVTEPAAPAAEPAAEPMEPAEQSKKPAEEAAKPAEQPKEPAEAAKEPAEAAGAGDLEPIVIELPQAQFPGTPPALRFGDRVEKPLGKPRPPFKAPKGTTNVALKKPVRGSDEEPIIGELKLITDGDKEASDGSFVELGPGRQYVQIDLGAEYNIYAVVIWHYHQQPRVYHDVVVQVSSDQDFLTDVTTVFNNDYDNSAGLGVGEGLERIETNEGHLIDSKGVKGRYVRLYSNGNTTDDFNHYIEVAVYGKPAP
jgi:hypothetical protein